MWVTQLQITPAWNLVNVSFNCTSTCLHEHVDNCRSVKTTFHPACLVWINQFLHICSVLLLKENVGRSPAIEIRIEVLAVAPFYCRKVATGNLSFWRNDWVRYCLMEPDYAFIRSHVHKALYRKSLGKCTDTSLFQRCWSSPPQEIVRLTKPSNICPSRMLTR